MRKYLLTASLLALLSVFVSACAGQPAAPQPSAAQPAAQAPAPAMSSAPIQFGYGTAWTLPSVFTAAKKGLFAQAGVKVESVNFPSSSQVTEALIAGKLDVGVLSNPPYIIARAKGVPVRAVLLATGYDFSTPESSNKPYTPVIAVKAGSPIKSVKDLRGKKIGINNYASDFDIYLRALLEHEGLDPKKDVTILEIPIPQQLTALTGGQIDAAFVTQLTAHIGLANKSIDYIADYGALPELKQNRINTLEVVMTEKFLKERPQEAQAVVNALVAGAKYAKENPADTKAIWAETSGSQAVANLTLPFIPTDGKLHAGGMQVDIDLMVRYGYLSKAMKAEEIIDHSLLK